MASVRKEDKEYINSIIKSRIDLIIEIKALKNIKNKTKTDYRNIIKECKEFVKYTEILQKYGYKVSIWTDYVDPSYWQAELDKFVGNDIMKPKKKVKKDTKPLIENSEQIASESLYYIMLCWTLKHDCYICEDMIEAVKKYFEKLKSKINIEFMDCMSDKFPGRIEYTCTYKAKVSQDVYDIIISSAEYILDSHNASTYDECNVGIFGKKIS